MLYKELTFNKIWISSETAFVENKEALLLVCLNTRFSWYLSKFEIRKVQSIKTWKMFLIMF